jgi:phosphonate transport system ATP-binding protein
MLQISNLTVSYPGRSSPVLSRLSLSVGAGEKVAIIGPSGCGKTTLFRAISGFVPIEAGTIRVHDIDVGSARGRRLRTLRRCVALIPQKHDLIDGLAVYQNVMAGALGRWSGLRALRFLLLPRRAELDEARAALDSVSMSRTDLRRRTAELSGGQQQRAAIARALVQRPRLLVADEPIASLDPELSRQIIALLTSLASIHRLALLCSLHQREFAYEYFDRVIDLGHGEAEEVAYVSAPAPASAVGVAAAS